MSLRIQNDHARFKDIVRGKIKSNLKSYIKKGELIGKQGKDTITIPVPRIDLPNFRFGGASQGGVGQGPGQPGDPVDGDPQADGAVTWEPYSAARATLVIDRVDRSVPDLDGDLRAAWGDEVLSFT